MRRMLESLASRRPSRIGIRLFAFNLLVVFVPFTAVHEEVEVEVTEVKKN